MQALVIAGRLPAGESPTGWEFSAAAYDFYLNSPTLQGHQPVDLQTTLQWLAAHRSQLGGNSSSYLIRALSAAGRLPAEANASDWLDGG
jgi:hypothetical protein